LIFIYFLQNLSTAKNRNYWLQLVADFFNYFMVETLGLSFLNQLAHFIGKNNITSEHISEVLSL